jgi:hypothetical protein
MKFNPLENINTDAAHQIIRRIVQVGTINLSRHAKDRMAERRYSIQDIEYILLNGKITKKEFKEKFQNWVYTVRGDDLEGNDGGVVTIIISPMLSVIVTVLA